MALLLESLWNRYRPGADPLGYTIRRRQWTSLHLSPVQRASGVIPLKHIGRVLTFDRPEGPTVIHAHGLHHDAERVANCLVVPPAVLTTSIVHIRHSATGFLLSHEPPNITATQHLVRALMDSGWSPQTDPMDDEGALILPALLRATATFPTIRSRPTLPLALVDSLPVTNQLHTSLIQPGIPIA